MWAAEGGWGWRRSDAEVLRNAKTEKIGVFAGHGNRDRGRHDSTRERIAPGLDCDLPAATRGDAVV